MEATINTEVNEIEVPKANLKITPAVGLKPFAIDHVVSKTEQEKAELLAMNGLDISNIDTKIRNISSVKPVNSASNHTGNKEELYAQISPYLKSGIATFHDIFGGGGIMSLNVEAAHSVYNEYDANLTNLLDNLTRSLSD